MTNTSSSTGGGEAVLGIDRVWAAERRQGEGREVRLNIFVWQEREKRGAKGGFSEGKGV